MDGDSERPPTGTRLVPAIRRIVTGHDEAGVATILWDDSFAEPMPGKSGLTTPLWSTSAMPAGIHIGSYVIDPRTLPYDTPPPQNGTRLLVIDYGPGKSGTMHRTETIDYVIVMEGEIDMDMDEATVHLKAGDVMVQRGTNHAWCNRGTVNARIAFVLVDAMPLGIGNPRLRA
jgi:mannose-6-phosphate isomerase-like protein (cupin superfamily)